jgi:putative membrane protein
MNKAILMAGLALVGTGMGAQAQSKKEVMKAGMMAPPPMKSADIAPLVSAIGNNFDRLYAIHSTMGNLNEVALGKLAMTHSRNKNVLMVAKMTMTEHGAAQRDLAAAAKSQSYALPKDPGPVNKAFAQKLATMRGAAFDKMYMAAQTAGHEATITLTMHEIEHGQNARIKSYARNKLPGIVGHTSMIYTVAGQVDAPGSELRPAAVKKAAMGVAMQKMQGMKAMSMGKMSGKMGKM